jgi:POT family proton-dependent oligopeptide transporter
MTTDPPTTPTPDTGGWAGHPRGLSTLFFTEMWERFSYYGMRAFLILYLVAPVGSGGLGFAAADAASVYGTYTGSAWGAGILGGIVADRLLGQFNAVLVGGTIIALGHFTLAFKALPAFYSGLALVALGTGLLKPNVSTLVGSLYEPGDRRRDAGFSIFYMGINSGGLLGPIIAGYLAQRVDWHAGFACAGFGMAIGLAQYWRGRGRLQHGLDRLAREKASRGLSPVQYPVQNQDTGTGTDSVRGTVPVPAGRPGFSREEWSRILAIVIFFVFASLFWGAYEQAGSTLNLFADRYSTLTILGYTFPSSWLQSVQPVCVVLFAPMFAWLWKRLGRHEPSSPAKFAFGLLFVSLAFLLLVPAGTFAQAGLKVSPWWLIVAYAITEVGELCLSPVGLSVVTKLSPARIVGLMMGVFFLSNAAGNKIAGWAAGFLGSMPIATLFGTVAAITLAASAVLFLLVPWMKKLMGGVQ